MAYEVGDLVVENIGSTNLAIHRVTKVTPSGRIWVTQSNYVVTKPRHTVIKDEADLLQKRAAFFAERIAYMNRPDRDPSIDYSEDISRLEHCCDLPVTIRHLY